MRKTPLKQSSILNLPKPSSPARCALYAAAWCIACACHLPAHAAITNCTFTPPNLNFGTAQTMSGITPTTQSSMTIQCHSNRNADKYANICLYIGEGSEHNNGQNYWPRRMKRSSPSAAYAGFGIYTDAAFTDYWGTKGVWGRARPVLISGALTGTAPWGRAMRQNVTLYARMEPLPNTETNLDNVEAGYYVNHFDGGHTAWVAHSNTATALTDPTVCNTLTLPSGQLFPFRVEASIPNQCTIEKPVSDIDLGTRKPVGESDVSGTTEILVRCHSKDSNYNIGLEPSNGNKLGQGELAQTGITERIAYQLKLNSSNGSNWGNNGVTSSSAGNGVNKSAGTATPASSTTRKKFTIAAVVSPASLNVPAGNYSDKVTVTIYY